MFAIVLMFGNEMLFTSWLPSCVLTAFVLSFIPEVILDKIPVVIRVPVHGLLLPVGTAFLKTTISNALEIRDDVSG